MQYHPRPSIGEKAFTPGVSKAARKGCRSSRRVSEETPKAWVTAHMCYCTETLLFFCAASTPPTHLIDHVHILVRGRPHRRREDVKQPNNVAVPPAGAAGAAGAAGSVSSSGGSRSRGPAEKRRSWRSSATPPCLAPHPTPPRPHPSAPPRARSHRRCRRIWISRSVRFASSGLSKMLPAHNRRQNVGRRSFSTTFSPAMPG